MVSGNRKVEWSRSCVCKTCVKCYRQYLGDPKNTNLPICGRCEGSWSDYFCDICKEKTFTVDCKDCSCGRRVCDACHDLHDACCKQCLRERYGAIVEEMEWS